MDGTGDQNVPAGGKAEHVGAGVGRVLVQWRVHVEVLRGHLYLLSEMSKILSQRLRTGSERLETGRERRMCNMVIKISSDLVDYNLKVTI